jgi:hypothetical protein
MNSLSLSALYLGLLGLFSFTTAQQGPVISPQAIIVNPVPSYEVEVFVDRDTSGQGTPSYAVGEAIRVGVRVSEDAYVYLFNVRSDGGVNQILPNNYDSAGQDNYVRGGEAKYFPPEGAAYVFEAGAPEGSGQGDRGRQPGAARHLYAGEL